MASLDGILRALVGLPSSSLVLVQAVVNNLGVQHCGHFSADLEKFLQGWRAPYHFAIREVPNRRADGVTGLDYEVFWRRDAHDHAFRLDDPLVKGWLDNSNTYPAPLRDKTVVLWGTVLGDGTSRQVASLVWSGNRVQTSPLMLCQRGALLGCYELIKKFELDC